MAIVARARGEYVSNSFVYITLKTVQYAKKWGKGKLMLTHECFLIFLKSAVL